MAIGATLLAHASFKTGEKRYNQARMREASRWYGKTITRRAASGDGKLTSASLQSAENGARPEAKSLPVLVGYETQEAAWASTDRPTGFNRRRETFWRRQN
jgi:hypothetical protein